MRLIIGEGTKEYMTILTIESFPFSEKELKSKYRSLLHAHHEDKGGDKKKTQQIIEAYNFLKNMVVENVSKEKPALLKKDLFDLTKACSVCGGFGKIVTKSLYTKIKNSKDCYTCNGTGRVEMELFNPVIPRGAVLQ
jgi:DnaJ-class molecular chaperone